MLTGTATAAVLVGAVELNAYTVRYSRGYSNGASEKAKKHTSKKNDSKSKHTRDSLTVGRFSSTARA